MKQIFIFCCVVTLLVACSTDNDYLYSEALPVESVDIPDEFQLGEIYPITVHYYRPSTCHVFRNFYYVRDNNIRIVAPINYVFEHDEANNSCTDLEGELVEASFNFIVTGNGSYIFKFWQGENANGEDQYLTLEVPVIN